MTLKKDPQKKSTNFSENGVGFAVAEVVRGDGRQAALLHCQNLALHLEG